MQDGICVTHSFGSAGRSGLTKEESPLEQLGKRCSSHSDCSDNQFCNYGLCDHTSIEESGTPRNLRGGLTTGRLGLKKCFINMDFEWYEMCIRELGICYWAFGKG